MAVATAAERCRPSHRADPPSTPDLPAVPGLPDVETVLQPVTDVVQGPQLKLPQVNLPQSLPQVGPPRPAAQALAWERARG